MENTNYKGPSPPPPLAEETNDDDDNQKQVENENEEDATKPESVLLEKEAEHADNASINRDESKMALADDSVKVKFTSSNQHDGSQNGEPRVDIESGGGHKVAFAGMGKEELMRFAEDPFWVRLRWTLFALFWLIWLAMLVGAIIIVVMTPGCPPLPARDWWQRGAIYQVYPKSFLDSDGDGTGDLPGIKSKLDYFSDLGVNTLMINPIFPSPMNDGGYDISNFVDIDPSYGNISDFKDLIAGAKEKGLRVVLDFVPNHSSDQHPWFIKSKAREPGFEDFYIWRNGILAGDTPPNNWVSVFGGSAWTHDSSRNQYYLHQFDKSQPDLNLRNPLVREELKNVLKFWLDQGVDGFRVDAVKHLFEDAEFRDEPEADGVPPTPKSSVPRYSSLNHIYTTGLPEVFEILHEWRDYINSFAPEDDHKLLVVEVHDPLNKTMQYYGTENGSLADFPFNLEFVQHLKPDTTGSQVYNLISSWLGATPTGKWPNWVLGNHDVSRVASRTDPDLIDGLNMITSLLGGTPVIYYGEEIGMRDVQVPLKQLRDPAVLNLGEAHVGGFSRDWARTPMQWSNSSQGGFTSDTSLVLPLGDLSINVEAQMQDSNSHLGVVKRLLRLRAEPAIVYGELEFPLGKDPGQVVAFARVKKGSPGYAVVVNFGRNATHVNLSAKECCQNFKFPDDGVVEISSRGVDPETAVLGKLGTKAKVPLTNIPLGAREGVVLKFVPAF